MNDSPPADREIPSGYLRLTSRCKLGDGEFIRVGDFIQAFPDDETEFGEVLSIFQYVSAEGGNQETGPILLHVRWGFHLYELSPQQYKTHIPDSYRTHFNSNFNAMACNVIMPFVFTSGDKDFQWENTDILFINEVRRLVFMHTLPGLVLPRTPGPNPPPSVSRLLFLNTIVSFPREVYARLILDDPYVRNIQREDYVTKARDVPRRERGQAGRSQ